MGNCKWRHKYCTLGDNIASLNIYKYEVETSGFRAFHLYPTYKKSPVMNKPCPLKGLNIRIPIIVPIMGRVYESIVYITSTYNKP